MKSRIKNIFFVIASLITFNAGIAQQDPATLTGTFTEKVNAELRLFRTVNNKLHVLGEYAINPSNPEFVFALPADTAITYSLQVTIMKQGHMRLEADKWFSLPLTMKHGQTYSLKITPSKLSGEKKTGFELKPDIRKSSIAFISGKFVNWNFGANVTIQRVVDGGFEKINSISNSKEKSFLLPCVVKEEGFYYVNSPRWILRVYLKPADKLELAIDGTSGSYEVINGSEENQLMQKWQQLISPITKYGYNSLSIQKDSFDLNSYLNTYESLEPSIANFRNHIDHTGPRFSKLFKMAIDVDKELAPVLLLFNSSAKTINGFRTTPKNFSNVPSFYNRFIHAGKFNDASLLNVGETRSYMNLYTKLVIAALPEEKRKQLSLSEMLGLKINAISNDTLKSYFLKDQMSEIEVNNLTEFRSTFEPYKKYAKPAAVKKKYLEVYNQFSSDTAYVGKSSYNFSLPDSTGRMTSMKDFKGKVVFIDVWATWCGPCREQFPFLKEIEEEYKHNNDIVFLGISIDRARDRQKWINTIKKENLPPLQLFDDMGKSFARKYEIVGIPRFLLIGKDGKWIEVRCPRPAAKEELKKYLDKALEEVALTKQ
ncbi:MAG TPA: TlpA disulfide reductase family protein [Chitinophagaceae bacterium]|nr:TlpA disulfide reductase family protein [Chitinophagaceae bacterium]